MNGAPKEVGPRPAQTEDTDTNQTSSHQTADKPQCKAVSRQAAFDTLAHRRRHHRPSTGLRASGYREGWAAALLWFQREFDEHLDPIGKARLAAGLARSEAA